MDSMLGGPAGAGEESAANGGKASRHDQTVANQDGSGLSLGPREKQQQQLPHSPAKAFESDDALSDSASGIDEAGLMPEILVDPAALSRLLSEDFEEHSARAALRRHKND